MPFAGSRLVDLALSHGENNHRGCNTLMIILSEILLHASYCMHSAGQGKSLDFSSHKWPCATSKRITKTCDTVRILLDQHGA